MPDWPFVEYRTLSSSERSAFSMGPFGSKITKENYVATGVPVVRGVNLARGIFVDDNFVFIEPQKADELISANVAPGDLIFTHRGTIGQVSMVPRRPRFDRYVIGSSQVKTRLAESVAVPEFYYYWFMSPEGQRSILANASTVGVPGIATPLTSIKGLRVPLPPLATQRAIAAVLGALDDKIAVNGRIVAALDELSHTLFTKHFDKAINVNTDWRSGKLSDLCDTQYGYTASSIDKPVGPRFLRVKDINKRNWINWPEVPFCEIPADSLGRYRLHRGDIVVARMADPGKAAIVEDDEEAVFASYLVRLKTASLAHAYFVWGFLKSESYQEYVAASKSGSVQSNMNAKVIVGAPLDIPPLELMQKYFEAVDPLRQKLLAVLRESATLAALRDQLLPELMSGRLRTKDAEKVAEEAV